MSDEMQLPKAYESKDVEDGIYRVWMESGFFNPDKLPDAEDRKDPFTIVLPPPNVTGTLHMGHAVMLAIEDAMIRFARMSGKRALWIPGTDHAAVATESKVEQMLIDEGMENPKRELGRDAFLDRVRAFAQESHDTIVNQTKKMGSSLDWTREAFTLDEARHRAVNEVFKMMYEDGLIYRGYRVINWSVRGQSTCSDDELVYVERPAKLYTFKYSKDIPITIATTRPETKLGDTAIAVHPKGKWKKYIGQEFTVENFGQKGHTLTLKVIADEGIDDDFGTGALGVTPAHSPIDFEMYLKQKAAGNEIGLIQVIGEDGEMLLSAGDAYASLSAEEAREKIVGWLTEQGLLEQTQEITQNVGTSDRFKDVVEPLPKTQWFVDVNKKFPFKGEGVNGIKKGDLVTLKELMQTVVRDGQIQIVPDRFNKTYFHWIDNLRDWNISRQIWYGHQIPVWYKGEEVTVGTEPVKDGWQRDPDTLDTWFSSGLWTFSTLGWPEQTDDLERYHPTQVLETGYDILFFWVARMILMTTYTLGEIPFETVYLHGLVRDEKGRKMSKSLGNIINPLDMIERYGADATRLSLLIGSTPGNDTKLSEEKIAGYRNFTNKLWNISRFVLMTVGKAQRIDQAPVPQTLADRWILSRIDAVITKATEHYQKHEFSLLGELLRDFTWNEFADWYVEIAKVQGDQNTSDILLYVLERVLKLWHPFMPFVTEEIYKEFNEGLLMVATWPRVEGLKDQEAERQFVSLKEVVATARDYRQSFGVEKGVLEGVVAQGEYLQASEAAILRLSGLKSVTFEAGSGTASIQFVIPEELKVIARGKREAELAEKREYLQRLETKLADEAYTKGAPKVVVDRTREELENMKQRVKMLMEELAQLT